MDAMESHLTACVQESLALYLHDNAIFLCERLVADFPTEANVFLLATCYHRASQSYRAYNLLQGLMGDQSRYLYALCCLQLGKMVEAEAALMPDNDAQRVPNGAAGFYLLGRIYQLSNRHSAAIAYYATALQLDPMLWSAYEELCVLGADHEAALYGAAAAAAAPPRPLGAGSGAGAGAGVEGGAGMSGASPSFQGAATPAGGHLPARTPAMATAGAAAVPGTVPIGTAAATALRSGLGHGGMWTDARGQLLPTAVASTAGRSAAAADPDGTPPPGSFITPSPGMRQLGPGPAPAPKLVGGGRDGGGRLPWPATATPMGAPPPSAASIGLAAGTVLGGAQRKFVYDGKMRKVSGKLFAEPASVLRRLGDAREGGEQCAPDDEAMLSCSAVPGLSRCDRSVEGQAAALAMLAVLAEGLRLLSMYRCKEAVGAFNRLPPTQYQTGWVLTCVGRAYYEMVDYPQAARCFAWARQVDPFRLKGLEHYSTVLWHMKKELELSHLAQEAVALDRHSPYAWCVMGNCFSLQKEHETALRYFQRALQLDATLPYAYTLCGHEYFASEDFDKGITCYRNAIRIDPRHYNAWFGMGHIYFRQEKFGMAEYHFRRALAVNERSSVLRCYLGMALHKLKRNAEALEMLDAAIAGDPRNPLAKFERATVLLAEEEYRDALGELHALKDVAPREASVLFHMGKIYKKLGMVDEAMACFSNALDLQPPSADTNVIKAAIERINLADHEEEEEI